MSEELKKLIEEKTKLQDDYAPVDFDSYSIQDVSRTYFFEEAVNNDEEGRKSLDKDERVWRISSLTASVDDETRILVLPIPESKRTTKIAET